MKWHSERSEVHHVHPSCSVGNNIEDSNLRGGDGGKPLCRVCSSLAEEEKASESDCPLDQKPVRAIAAQIADRLGQPNSSAGQVWDLLKQVISGVIVGVCLIIAGCSVDSAVREAEVARAATTSRYEVMTRVFSLIVERLDSHYFRRKTQYGTRFSPSVRDAAQVRQYASMPVKLSRALLLPHFVGADAELDHLNEALNSVQAIDEELESIATTDKYATGGSEGDPSKRKEQAADALRGQAEEALARLGQALAAAVRSGSD